MTSLALDELLQRYVERLERDGTRVTPEELCGGTGELVEPLRARIHRFHEIDRMLGSPPGAAEAEPGELPTFAGFRTVERLGGGGMGEVYKLVDLTLGRTVAAKVLRAGSAASALYGDFLREARSMALFQDPRVVHIHEYRADAEPPVILMEYVDGFELGQVGRSLNHAQQARIMAEICAALQRAHELGIQHRDLKPSNILLDQRLQPKILDFGLSRGEPDQGHGVGTLEYLAPEQLDPGLPIDARADVYALGVILYELLCGERPYGEGSPDAIMATIRTGRPRLPVEVDPGAPEALQAIALKAMEREPGDRYPSARDMARDLERYLQGRSVLARPTLYATALGERVRPHLEQIREWVSLRLISAPEASTLEAAYRGLEVQEEDWIVHGRALTMSKISLYLGAFLLLVGALFYFVADRFYDAGGGLGEAVLTLAVPFVVLNAMALLLERQERRAVAIALYIGAAALLVPLLVIFMHELGLWVRVEGQFFDGGVVSNRQLQVATVAASLWALFLALRTRTVALSSIFTVLTTLTALAVTTDLGLRTWLDEGRWDLLGAHLVPLVVLFAGLGRATERWGRSWLASPLYVGAAVLYAAILELEAMDGRLFSHLGFTLAGLQPEGVDDPILLDTLAAMTVNGLLIYTVGSSLERWGGALARPAARVLLLVSPFAILEPIAWLNHTQEYSRVFDWLFLVLSLGVVLASRLRQRRSFYYAGLVNIGLALVLLADRYEWLDAPWWAITVILAALAAVAAGLRLDARERRRRVE